MARASPARRRYRRRSRSGAPPRISSNRCPFAHLDAEKRATWLATQHAVFADLTNLFAQAPPAAPQAASARPGAAVEGVRRAPSCGAHAPALCRDARPSRQRGGARLTATTTEPLSRVDGAAGGARLHQTRPDEPRARSLDALARNGCRTVARRRTSPQCTSAAAPARGAGCHGGGYAAAGRDDMLAFVLDSGAHPLRPPRQSAAPSRPRPRSCTNVCAIPEAAARDMTSGRARGRARVVADCRARFTHRRVLAIPDVHGRTRRSPRRPGGRRRTRRLCSSAPTLSMLPSLLFVTRPHADAQRSNAARFELIGDPAFRAGDWQRECAPSRAPARWRRRQRSNGASPRGAAASTGQSRRGPRHPGIGAPLTSRRSRRVAPRLRRPRGTDFERPRPARRHCCTSPLMAMWMPSPTLCPP